MEIAEVAEQETVAPEKLERFHHAMWAWLPVQTYVTKHGYIFDFPSDTGQGSITCRECKRAVNYGDPGVNEHSPEDWLEHIEWVEHTGKCRLMLAEKGLELLRKMATSVE